MSFAQNPHINKHRLQKRVCCKISPSHTVTCAPRNYSPCLTGSIISVSGPPIIAFPSLFPSIFSFSLTSRFPFPLPHPSILKARALSSLSLIFLSLIRPKAFRCTPLSTRVVQKQKERERENEQRVRKREKEKG